MTAPSASGLPTSSRNNQAREPVDGKTNRRHGSQPLTRSRAEVTRSAAGSDTGSDTGWEDEWQLLDHLTVGSSSLHPAGRSAQPLNNLPSNQTIARVPSTASSTDEADGLAYHFPIDFDKLAGVPCRVQKTTQLPKKLLCISATSSTLSTSDGAVDALGEPLPEQEEPLFTAANADEPDQPVTPMAADAAIQPQQQPDLETVPALDGRSVALLGQNVAAVGGQEQRTVEPIQASSEPDWHALIIHIPSSP